MDCVPTNTIHGIPLCEENVRVTINIPKPKHALLPISTNEATIIEEAVGGFVAWPKKLIVIETSMSQTSQGPSHVPDREVEGSKRIKKIAGKKKLQSQSEVQQQTAQQQLPPFNFSEIPHDLRPLAFCAQCSMHDGLQIACPTQQSISGKTCLYILVFDSWDDSVMYFNPLGNEPGDDFHDLIKLALNDWKILVRKGIRKRRNYETLIDIVRCRLQEGYVECGYFVLAFMQEITFTFNGLSLLQTKDFYTDMTRV
ncbi:hypothetical protein TIFTF001_015471 [Ficus carica]|uniref:DUF8039 domain-containing protein n=1 Tax=Ficus carica TaxID=3494 RepID=A0AA88A5Q7_FICCA|nr:hypothetical protein TIFTF001_015471 [Ficus carica]